MWSEPLTVDQFIKIGGDMQDIEHIMVSEMMSAKEAKKLIDDTKKQ